MCCCVLLNSGSLQYTCHVWRTYPCDCTMKPLNKYNHATSTANSSLPFSNASNSSATSKPSLFEITLYQNHFFFFSFPLPQIKGNSTKSQATVLLLNFKPHSNHTFVLCYVTTYFTQSVYVKICGHAFRVIWMIDAVRMQDHYHFT